MGLFRKFLKIDKPDNMGLKYDDFARWLDAVFEAGIPDYVVGIAFNLYEETDSHWAAEVVGTSSVDESDDDWACDEATDFNTRENPFSWQEDASWEEVLSEVNDIVVKYLEAGKYSHRLKEMKAVACGFVDGDLEILYAKR